MSSGRRKWLRPGAIASAALAVCLLYFGWTCLRIVGQSSRDEAQTSDCIVVFGAAEYYGRPSPVFRARLDHAFELYQRHLAPVIIVTGGNGGEQSFSEGAVGRDYLIARGIRDSHLIAETQSDNSAESAERVGTIMQANNMHTCIAVSDPYHVFRIKQLLEARGMRAYASPRRLDATVGMWARALRVSREALSYTLWRLYIFRR
jgi:uncharacterized SAM-binding protein YcdF (DUF218 family)